jgi:hypothetical protein
LAHHRLANGASDYPLHDAFLRSDALGRSKAKYGTYLSEDPTLLLSECRVRCEPSRVPTRPNRNDSDAPMVKELVYQAVARHHQTLENRRLVPHYIQ